MSTRCVLGIDGGGTKTVCVAADENGRVLGRGLGGPVNPHSEGLDRSRRSLEEAIGGALAESGIPAEAVACVGAGLAGVARPKDREVMEGLLRRLLPVPELVLDLDALAALVGATGGRPGVIVISGTGSVAFGIDRRGQRARCGGWGFILGDEGSGYDIARRGLIAALRAYDGRGLETMVRVRLEEQLGLKSTEELIPFLYSNPLSPARVASLYPIVLDAADNGDVVARQLILDSASALAEMGVTTATKLDFSDGETLISTAGGVFKGRTLREEFEHAVRSRLPSAEIVEAAHPPEMGAVFLAVARLKGQPLFEGV